ncbi:MAG: tRNA uridine-5-carboxymethylaminomethyl(34) synthesis GTPase MnmE, partial [Candidatus Cloacimonadota bacterium]|nr:tRNA uridine-5-carboxymethylaminomethyl(34) synthesis GTPase MnmE [Candidatus Cloacimonadota bacterium]
AYDALDTAISSFQQNLGPEFTAFDLKEASLALEEIIGRVTSEDILNKIFSNFCVGK